MAENIDEFDRRILRVLQRDASMSVDALAEKVHLSRNACWRRVKLMEERGVIRGRVTLVAPSAVDLDLSVFVLIRTIRAGCRHSTVRCVICRKSSVRIV